MSTSIFDVLKEYKVTEVFTTQPLRGTRNVLPKTVLDSKPDAVLVRKITIKENGIWQYPYGSVLYILNRDLVRTIKQVYPFKERLDKLVTVYLFDDNCETVETIKIKKLIVNSTPRRPINKDDLTESRRLECFHYVYLVCTKSKSF